MRVPYSSSNVRLNEFFQNLTNSLQSGTFCDVTFSVDNQQFPCHRIIVASYSPYFQALLTHQFKENHQHTIELTNIDSSIFSLILQYMYSGKIEIDDDYVRELFVASDMFQLDEIVQFCCHYMSISLNEQNVIETWRIANKIECSSLKNDAENYVLMHFRGLIRRDLIKHLPKSLFIQTISHDDLIVDHEHQVLEAILVWYLNNREQPFEQLLDNVRLEFISKEHQTMILNQIGLVNQLSNIVFFLL